MFEEVGALSSMAEASQVPRVYGGTRTLTDWHAASTAGRWYAIALTAAEVRGLIGRAYDPARDAFLSMSAQSNRSASIEVATVNEYGNLYVYATGDPTSMSVAWMLVAG